MTVADLKSKYGKKLTRLLCEVKDFRHAHSVQVTQVDPVSAGLALRKMREDADISLRDMAKRLELSAPFLSDCELGRRNLSLSHTIAFFAEVQKYASSSPPLKLVRQKMIQSY